MVSRPARGEWIEIMMQMGGGEVQTVSPREGRVD